MSELITRAPSAPPAVHEPRPQNIWIDDYLDEKQSEIARYGRIILKRKWLVLCVALGVLAASGGWTLTTKRVYTASVNLQIDPEQSILPYKEMYDAVTGDPRYLGTQGQVLKSEALARRIVTRLNPTADAKRVTQLARTFTGDLVVTPVEGTQVVKVTYRSEDPEFAATAINTLADEYVNYGFETKSETTTRARDFLEKELSKLKQKLEQSEQRLVNYGRAHDILFAPEDNIVRQKLADLNHEMTRVEAEVLSNQYDTLKSTPLESFPEKLKTNVMRTLDSRRSELEQKLATMTMQFGSKWPEVVSLNQELAEVRQQLATERKSALEQAKVEYNIAVAHSERLATALATQNGLADKLAQDSIQYNILKREVETDRQLHEGLLQRLKETDVSSGLKAGNVHVIDRGHVPTLPSSPNIPFNLMLGLTLGLMSGVMVASTVEFFDRTIKTPEDVERELRLPFLGAIPVFDRAWREASGGHLMPLNSQSVQALPYVNSSAAMYWECYRSVRTSLLFSSPENRPRSILVTAAMPGEGKTTTTVNLAIALAQTGARTIILELDMRRPAVADMFELTSGRGMSRYLSGHCELNTEIQQTGVPNLFVVPAGPIPPNPPELIGSSRMKTALELLSRHFEYVIIDGPPLIPVTDAAVISSLVNGVILVVGAKTSTATVQKARNLLRSVDANILGALVNNAKIDVSDHYYAAIH